MVAILFLGQSVKKRLTIDPLHVKLFQGKVQYVFPCYVMSFSLTLILDSLTHWGWVMHKCASKLTIIGSDNGLAPVRRRAIIWTNAGKIVNWNFGNKLHWKLIQCHSRKCIWKRCLENGGHFVSASMCLIYFQDDHPCWWSDDNKTQGTSWYEHWLVSVWLEDALQRVG